MSTSLTIPSLCESLNLDKNACPNCGKSKLWIKTDFFKCFKAGCGVSGNVVNYIMITNKVTYTEAYTYLKDKFDYIDTSKLHPSDNHYNNTEVKERREILAKIFNLCKQYKTDYKAVDYIKSRGLDPNKIEYGFWPRNSNGNRDLIRLNTGLKLNKLQELKLVNSKNEEIFTDRVIFPIKNLNGDIIYFQGRSLDPDANLRWLTSANDSKLEQSVFSYFYNTNILKKDNKILFVCEGITDALSLQQLDLNVISSLNLYPPLLKYRDSLSEVDYLIVFYDNDKININYNSKDLNQVNIKNTVYKSWDSVLDILISLKYMRPDLNICCIMPPEKTGITDINEWLVSINFDKEIALKYINTNHLTLEEFLIDKFLIDKREDIFTLISIAQPEYKEKLKDILACKINRNYKSWVDFIVS